MDPLHAYTLKIVELGQRTLALHRRGQGLPEELMALAAELLALDAELRQRAIAFPEAAAVAGWDSVVSPASPTTEDGMMVLGADEIDGSPVFIQEPLNTPSPIIIDVPPVPADGVAAEPRTCARCGETLRPGKRFCHRCGSPA